LLSDRMKLAAQHGGRAPAGRPVRGEEHVLKWALIFFVISIVAGFFGFSGLSAATAGIAKVLFFIAIIIFAIFILLAIFAGQAIL
jgi:uncharacterized membrane protein YtjA (UPF0391 family)